MENVEPLSKNKMMDNQHLQKLCCFFLPTYVSALILDSLACIVCFFPG